MDKLILRIGMTTYVILAALALIFYIERTVFLDIAFHLFYILKDSDFAIQNNRFGAIMTQIFPLISSKLEWPLSMVMATYSVGFVVYYFAIFFIITKVLKSYKFGLAMILLSTLMVTDTFYWIQSELQQGLAFLLLYFALLYSENANEWFNRWYSYPIMALMLVTIAFFHPLLLFPFLFCTSFLFISSPSLKRILIGSLVFYFLIIVVKTFLFRTAYDSTAMSGLGNFIKLFPNYFAMPSNSQFLVDLISKYYAMILLFCIMVLYYCKNKSFDKIFIITSFCVGYILLVNVSYPNGAESFYMENLYLPLSVFVALPFALDISSKINKYFALLLVLMISMRIVHIGIHHKLYSERLDLLQNYLNETKSLESKKLVIAEKYFPMDVMLMTWATPYEFWLLSTVNDGKASSVMISDNVKDVEWAANDNKVFITKWGAFKYSDLPQKYFIFEDTSLYQLKY